MNLFAAFQSEVFRPLVTLLIPGVFGMSSWIMVLFWKYPYLKALALANCVETAVILFFVIPAAGMMIEDLGARFETYRDGKLNTKPKGEHLRIWYDYLRTAYEKDKEPIGRGYIRTVVLRLKFELGMAIASIITVAGVAMLYFLGLRGGRALLFVVLLSLLAVYEGAEGIASHKLLARTRRELMRGTQAVHPDDDRSQAAQAS